MNGNSTRQRENDTDSPFSEDQWALDFAKLYPNYRWVQAWGKWLRWDDQVWNEDSTLHTFWWMK